MRKFLFTIFCLLMLLLPLSRVFAASLNLVTPTKNLGVGDSFEVGVVLESPTEKVNAFSGNIIIPTNDFSVTAIRDGQGAIPLWIERPTLTAEGVKFAGGVPGGLQGSNNVLFSMVLTAKRAGRISLGINNATAFKNDGRGTLAEINTVPLNLVVKNESQNLVTPDLTDHSAPEPFMATITTDDKFFDGHSFVTFSAQDKLSGVDHYEWATSTKREPGENLIWHRTESPLILDKANPHYFVYIKAVDRQGNIKIARAPLSLPLWWYEKILIWIILIVVCGLFGWRMFVKR